MAREAAQADDLRILGLCYVNFQGCDRICCECSLREVKLQGSIMIRRPAIIRCLGAPLDFCFSGGCTSSRLDQAFKILLQGGHGRSRLDEAVSESLALFYNELFQAYPSTFTALCSRVPHVTAEGG